MVQTSRSWRHTLTDEQRKAVHAPIGATLVPAGPGSGKTTVTTARVAWMIEDMNIPPESIAVFTFTNRAAQELRDRLDHTLRPADIAGLWAGTFHSWGARFLRTHGQDCGLEPDFVIYDQSDALDAVHRAMTQVNDATGKDRSGPRKQMRRISRWKNLDRTVEQMISPWLTRIGRGDISAKVTQLMVWQEYDRWMREQNAADFDDLIVLPLRILRNNEAALRETQARMRHILVDEYQDTSRAQHELVVRLAMRADGERTSLFVVGDSDQSIYGFRDADIRNFNNFSTDYYPEARQLHLENNYRSTGTIVRAAQQIIERNRRRIVRHSTVTRENGALIRWAGFDNPEHEASVIVEDIAQRIADGANRPEQFCVAYRTNPQSRPIEEALYQAGVPYIVAGNSHFFQREEIRAHLDYLRLAMHPSNNIILKRVINTPGRSISDRAWRQLETYAATNEISAWLALHEMTDDDSPDWPPKARDNARVFINTMQDLSERVSSRAPVGELIRMISLDCGLLDHYKALKDGSGKAENIRELHAIADQTPADPAAFLERTAMHNAVPANETTGRVTLATIHQTKGLEFDVVYLAGIEAGVIPITTPDDRLAEIEEERRLLYVGMTRARDELNITWCHQRPATDRAGSALTATGPSQFIAEIPSWAWGEAIPEAAERAETR